MSASLIPQPKSLRILLSNSCVKTVCLFLTISGSNEEFLSRGVCNSNVPREDFIFLVNLPLRRFFIAGSCVCSSVFKCAFISPSKAFSSRLLRSGVKMPVSPSNGLPSRIA